MFVVTSRPKTDVFEVAVAGKMHNSHLNNRISLSFPKNATAICITCEIQVLVQFPFPARLGRLMITQKGILILLNFNLFIELN